MKIKTAPQFLGLFLVSYLLILSSPSQAGTFTWTGTSGGSWGVNANWASSTSGTWPATSDAVIISNTNGGTQNIWYDAVPLDTTTNASGTISSLALTQPDSGVNQLSLVRSLKVSNSITLGGAGNGISMIVVDGATSGTTNASVTGTINEVITLTVPTITLNQNGVLALTVSGTDPGKAGSIGSYLAAINGNVLISGGAFIQYNDINQKVTESAQCSVSGSLVMTGGTLVIGGTPSSYTADVSKWDPRLSVSGAVNISGGVFAASNGSIVVNYNGVNSITGLSSTTSMINKVMLQGANQTFYSASSPGNQYINQLIARSWGTYTKIIGATTGTGTLAIGFLGMGESYTSGTSIVQLYSDVTASDLTAPLQISFSPTSGVGPIGFQLDLAGHNFLGTAKSGIAQLITGGTYATTWNIINSAATTGTLMAGFINMTSTTAVNVGLNSTGAVVLASTGTGGGTNNLGGSSSVSGTISANTIFSYVGSGSAYLTSGRMIGGLSVGDGSSNSLLILASNITTGTNSQVTVNAGGNLGLGNNNLYLTPNPTTTINIARSGTISSSGTGALYLNTGIGFSVTGGSGNATVASNVNVSGAYTFDPSHLSGTGLVISGKIVDGTTPASIVVNGPVSLSLTGASTYTGGLTVTGGTVYLGSTGAGSGGLVISGTGNGNALVQLSASATGMSSVTLSGVTGGNGILDVMTWGIGSASGLVTVNSGGILQTSATSYTTMAATSSTIVVNSGGILRTVNLVNCVENSVGTVILNNGALLTTSTGGAQNGGGRIAVYGNFTANAGSTINTNDANGGYLALYGTSANIADGVTLTNPTGGVNTIAMVRGSGTQVLQSGVNLGKLYLRDNDVLATDSVKLLQLTGTATTVNMIQMTNTETIASGMTNTLRLGSNITSINGLDGNNYFSIGRLAMDLAGYTFAISNTGWAPQMTGTNTSPWAITSSSGTGLFQAQYFNLSSPNTDITIGANVVLQATLAGGTSELGLKATSGSGTIAAASTFLYSGNGTHYLKTTTSRSIGNLQVGDGSSASKLGLLTDITTGAGSTVNVNAGSTLDLQTYALNTNGEIQLNGGTVTGSNGSSFNIAGKVTASGTINSSISAPIALSGTQTVEVTNAATSLSIAGNISGATGGLTKTGAGSLFLNGNSSYSGLTEVSAGLLGVNGTLTADGGVNVKSGASLSGTGIVSGIVTNSGAIIGGLTFDNDVAINNGATAAAKAFNGNIANNGTITSDVTVQSGKTLSGNGTASGAVNVQSGNINGSGMNLGATKFDGQSALTGTTTAASYTVNSGATTASGVHTTTGNLAVNVGSTLTNTGSFSANIVSVASTATLTNNGTLNGTVNVSGLLNGTGTINGALTIKTDGELAPGNSPGITTVAGNLTVETGAKISMQIEGITAAGTDYDQIVVTGASSLISLNGGSILNLTIADGAFTSGALTLILNQSDNAIVGTFSSVVIGGNTYDVSTTNKFTYGGKEYELLYNVNADGGTTANDFELTVVPEPGTWAMLVGGLGLLLGAQRMRRRSE